MTGSNPVHQKDVSDGQSGCSKIFSIKLPQVRAPKRSHSRQNELESQLQLRGHSGKTAEEEWSLGAKIGDAAFNWKEGVFCVDDPASGPALFRISNHIKSRTYEIDRERRINRPRVRVRVRHPLRQSIRDSERGIVPKWVQVVTTAEIDGVPVISRPRWAPWTIRRKYFSGSEPDTGASGCMAFVCQNLQAAIKVIGKAELGGEEGNDRKFASGGQGGNSGGEQGSQVV
ncbi:hypothetical protein C8R43DRAFT_1128061 [Mycena crocata]|nr:hypothetical protein C8R43DRAFT_1128061 [Mycena crocata]